MVPNIQKHNSLIFLKIDIFKLKQSTTIKSCFSSTIL